MMMAAALRHSGGRCVYGFIKPGSPSIAVEVSGPQPDRPYQSVFVWRWRPMGAFSEVGPAEWKGRICSYRFGASHSV